MNEKEKSELGASAMEAFFKQFGVMDAHSEIVLNIIFELIYNSEVDNEFIHLSSKKRQERDETPLCGSKPKSDSTDENSKY